MPVAPCTHRWLIAKPNGATSEGVCSDCGEVRKDFSNVSPESGWRGWKRASPPPKKKA